MRNAGRVLGALLCTAALAGSALALRVVPGGRVLALLFVLPARRSRSAAGRVEPPAGPAGCRLGRIIGITAAAHPGTIRPANPQPHTAAHDGTGSHPGPNHYHTAGGADDSAHP